MPFFRTIIIIFRQFYKRVEKRDQIYVITGGPGFGKSAVISHLKKLGYKTGAEAAREIIHEQQQTGGSVLPAKDIRSFQQEVLKRRISFYQSVTGNETAFCDRAIPDQIAFARFNGFRIPDSLSQAVRDFWYNKKVFITPPWKKIYRTDQVRTESYEKACEIHQHIVNVYTELGYILIEIPMYKVQERVKFILNLI